MTDARDFERAGMSEAALAQVIDFPFGELLARENPHPVPLGWTQVEGQNIYMVRAHHGQAHETDDPDSMLATYNGGSRLIRIDPSRISPGMSFEDVVTADAMKLAQGMSGKRGAVGSRKNGAKFEFGSDGNPTKLSRVGLELLMLTANDRMNAAEIAGEQYVVRSIVAPDVNTGIPGLFDVYANAQVRRGDPLGLASAGGKLKGGNKFRPDSTADTTFRAVLEGREMTDPSRRHSMKAQGAGNVGLVLGRIATEDEHERLETVAYSDTAPHPTRPGDRIVRTIMVPEGSGGIRVSRELEQRILAERPADRVAVIEHDIQHNQPHIADRYRVETGQQAFFEVDADWMVLAALGNTLNVDNLPPDTSEAADKLARLGVIGAENHPWDDAGYRYLVRYGKLPMPDSNTNFGGTRCTDIETRDNIIFKDAWAEYTTYESSQAEIAAIARGRWHQLRRVMEETGVDLQQASLLVSIGNRALWHGMRSELDTRLAAYLAA